MGYVVQVFFILHEIVQISTISMLWKVKEDLNFIKDLNLQTEKNTRKYTYTQGRLTKKLI